MRYVIILLLGLLLGGGAAVFFLGIPRAKSTPGVRVQPPESSGDPAGTVVITVSDSFFSQVLGTIFHDLGAPSFQLAETGPEAQLATIQHITLLQSCTNSIMLAPEEGSVQTKVQFASGKISAPLAFGGSYNLLGNCMQFKGWADTTIQLRFDQSNQTVYGQMNVESVNLEGVNPMANNFVTVFVRNAIDQKVNPLELIRASQLQLLIPVKASNGSLKAQVKDVRAEVLDGTLRLHITYEFKGDRSQQGAG
jgi:hypothetical protein